MLVTLNTRPGEARYVQACPGCVGLERLAKRRIEQHDEAAREQRAIDRACRMDAERQRLLSRGSIRGHTCGRPGYPCSRRLHAERQTYLYAEARESRAVALAHERLAAAARDDLALAQERQRDGTCLLCWRPRPRLDGGAPVGGPGAAGRPS